MKKKKIVGIQSLLHHPKLEFDFWEGNFNPATGGGFSSDHQGKCLAIIKRENSAVFKNYLAGDL